MKVQFKKLIPLAKMPVYATDGSGAFDFYATNSFNVLVSKGFSQEFGTGLSIEVPKGYVLLLFSRSGHGFNHGARLGNCVGIIDSDYRGEIKVMLHCDKQDLMVMPFARICQGMIFPVEHVEFIESDELSETVRGECGCGSTGQV